MILPREIVLISWVYHPIFVTESSLQVRWWLQYYGTTAGAHRKSLSKRLFGGLTGRAGWKCDLEYGDGFRHHELLLAAESGATGIEGFDEWAHELVQTGYLHNHARMWFASIWIFTLKLPWTLGANFFLRHLIDADPASNTLSWRWVAGLQTTGKVYLATSDNIARYTGGRFCPQSRTMSLSERQFYF